MRIELEGSGSDGGSGSGSDENSGSGGGGDVPAIIRQGGGREDGGVDYNGALPTNVYDLDRVLTNTPLVQAGNAFHDTLNGTFLSYGDTAMQTAVVQIQFRAPWMPPKVSSYNACISVSVVLMGVSGLGS